MIKEPKHIDFYTSGRELSTEDFALISQWIAADKQKQSAQSREGLRKDKKSVVRAEDNGNS